MAGPVPYINININIIKVNSFKMHPQSMWVKIYWQNGIIQIRKFKRLGQNMGDGTNFVGTRSAVDDRDQIDFNSF